MILNENSDKYIQPDDININLKEHQLAMLHKSLNIEENNEFAIMKDKPGSGKTYVVLTMINELKKKDIKNKLPKKTNVIVVPQNIYFQWSYSIDRLTENLSYLKFVEYEHLLNLYSEPQTLYNKDIILVTSSYYNSLASTLTSLELNVDRLFIDEIDNVGNFINQSFNTKFIMFISASFSFNNNNGFFTNKLKDKSEEDITIICDEKFIDTQINLENPNIEVYLCKNLYIDKVLINIITQDELKNINACYYKLDDKNYNQIIAKDEKSLISLIFNENKSVIEKFKNKIEDCKKNIDFYEQKLNNKSEYINQFNNDIKNIGKIFSFKKDSLKLIDDLLEYFNFYLNPIIDQDYKEFYDIIVSNRKTNLKEFKIYIHNLNESIYYLYKLDLSNNGIDENNIDNLSKVFKIINGVIKNKSTDVNKFFDDLKRINETKNIDKFIINFINLYEEFENYILNFYELLNNLEVVLKSVHLLKNIKEYYDTFQKEKDEYISKRDTLLEKLKKNDICPVCYEIFENNENYYISNCCNNNICIKCTEEWFYKMERHSCIYCNTSDILISSYIKYENENENEIEDGKKNNKDISKYYNSYLGSKVDYLHNFIVDLQNNNYKVIIFCDHNTIFQKLEIICNQNNIEYEDLEKGNINEIEKTLCNYKYGNSKILFANSSLFSCGMNLENSTHILFVHKMDKNTIDQTIGRAQRLGRQNRLNVIYLEYENEQYFENFSKKEFIEKTMEIMDDSEQTLLYNNDNNDINTSLKYINIQDFKNDIKNDINNTDININNENDINDENEVVLPSYGEVIDVNLDDLISSLN